MLRANIELWCTPSTCTEPTAAAGTTYNGMSGKTTTQTGSVSCADGYSGGGSATCTADNGQTTSSWIFTGCTVSTCPDPNAAAGTTYSGMSGKTTTQTGTVTCADGYSGGGSATCTGDTNMDGWPSQTTSSWVYSRVEKKD